MDLRALRLEHFSERLEQLFDVDCDGRTLQLKLIEASALRSVSDTEVRPPFSLLFLGPADPELPQRIYALETDALGRLEIFLVALGPEREGRGMLYEAVFA